MLQSSPPATRGLPIWGISGSFHDADRDLRFSALETPLVRLQPDPPRTKGCLTLLRAATLSLFNMGVDPMPEFRFALCAIRDTNEHIGQFILLQLELISIPFE